MSPVPSDTASIALPDARPLGPALMAIAGAAAAVSGLFLHGVWRELPAERLLLALVLALFVWGLAWPVRRLLRCAWASAFAGLWAIALLGYIGPLPVLAAAGLGLGGLALGLWLTPAQLPARAAIATIVGLLSIAMVTGWLVTLPIHTWWLWCTVLLGLTVLQRDALARALRDAAHGWREATTAAPRAAAFTLMLLGLASVACWIPALQSDDLGYHLGLPTQLMAHARYAPDAEHQVWSYAPWAGDILHGLGFVLARQDAHGAINALWLALTAGALWSITASLRATPTERWSALALFASFPPLVWMAAGMQTELAATATLCALVAVVVAEPSTSGRWPRRLLAGTVLLAALFALKLVHGLSALPVLIYALWRHRQRLPWAWLPPALLLFVALAASSYAQSWRDTGNPLLPMFNQFFASPYFPREQFHDPRWHAGFGPDILWRLTFETPRYVEAWRGGLGFALIALAGLWCLQLLRPGRRALMWAVSIALLLPLMPMQYARYAWPGIVLLLALLPVGTEAMLSRRLFVALLAGVCASNLAYQANASWLHHSAVIKRTLRSGADPESVLPSYLAERLLMRNLPTDSAQLVLAADPARNVVAELGGRGRTVSLHDPSLQADARRAERDASGAEWQALLGREQIRWVLVNRATASPALRAGLMRARAQRSEQLHGIELWRLPATPRAERAP